LGGNTATFLININKEVLKNDNKLTTNIKGIMCEEKFQINKLENNEECHNGNRSAPDTEILTEKRKGGIPDGIT
jgi:hypothetical protein